MKQTKVAALLMSLSFTGASIASGATTPPTTPSVSQPSSGCISLPSTIKCSMEGKSKGLSQVYPIVSIDATDAEDCYTACTSQFWNERCVAWAFTPSANRCTLFDYAVNVNYYAEDGTGTFLWDRVCLECDGTRTTTSAAPTFTGCLPPDSKCNVEGSWNPGNLEELQKFGTYIGASKPWDCYEYCLDRKYWGRCRSWVYTPSEEMCELFSVAINLGFVSEAGTGKYFYDRMC